MRSASQKGKALRQTSTQGTFQTHMADVAPSRIFFRLLKKNINSNYFALNISGTNIF